MNHLHRTRRRNGLQNHSYQPSITCASKMFEYVRLSTHSTSLPEVLSRECVGRLLRYPSKPAGSSRRDKASWARPPFESLSQASLGQAQLHILFAEENIIKLFSLMDALSTLWSRVISSTCSIDLCIEFMIVANNILRKHGIHVMPSWTSFKHALILSLIQSSVDDCPTLCYPLSVDTRYILRTLLSSEQSLGWTWTMILTKEKHKMLRSY